jgi:orotidine-5'-phosphate decarboxylase
LFADRLIEAIERKGAPICIGIDPILHLMPREIMDDRAITGNDPTVAVDAIFDFTTQALKIIAEHAPCVKFQSAYFEQHYSEGVEAYYSLIAEAKELGLLVIGDVKRGDIGSTSQAYAQAHLANPPTTLEDVDTPDAITVNPMLGIDSIQPFIDTARRFDKGLFVLVRTSNPGSAQFQDAKLADGRTWSEHVADTLNETQNNLAIFGTSGFGPIGAVVGATQPHTMQSLRQRLPRSIFLLPGYGAQGATAEMTKAGFLDGRGAIVSASRSILYPKRPPRSDWKQSIDQALRAMKQDLATIIQ